MTISISNSSETARSGQVAASASDGVGAGEKAQASGDRTYLGVSLQEVRTLMASLAQSQGRVPQQLADRQQKLSRHLESIEKRSAKVSGETGGKAGGQLSSLITRIVGKYPEVNQEISAALAREQLSSQLGDRLAAEVSRNIANMPAVLQKDTSAGRALLEFVAQAAVARLDEKQLSDSWRQQIAENSLAVVKNSTPREQQEVSRVLDDSVKFIYRNQSDTARADTTAMREAGGAGGGLPATAEGTAQIGKAAEAGAGGQITYLKMFSQNPAVRGDSEVSAAMLQKINSIIVKAAQLAVSSNLIEPPEETLSQIIEEEDFSLEDLKFVNSLITKASSGAGSSGQVMSKAALMHSGARTAEAAPPTQEELNAEIRRHMDTIHTSGDLKTIENALQRINELNRQLADLKSRNVIAEATRPDRKADAPQAEGVRNSVAARIPDPALPAGENAALLRGGAQSAKAPGNTETRLPETGASAAERGGGARGTEANAQSRPEAGRPVVENAAAGNRPQSLFSLAGEARENIAGPEPEPSVRSASSKELSMRQPTEATVRQDDSGRAAPRQTAGSPLRAGYPWGQASQEPAREPLRSGDPVAQTPRQPAGSPLRAGYPWGQASYEPDQTPLRSGDPVAQAPRQPADAQLRAGDPWGQASRQPVDAQLRPVGSGEQAAHQSADPPPRLSDQMSMSPRLQPQPDRISPQTSQTAPGRQNFPGPADSAGSVRDAEGAGSSQRTSDRLPHTDRQTDGSLRPERADNATAQNSRIREGSGTDVAARVRAGIQNNQVPATDLQQSRMPETADQSQRRLAPNAMSFGDPKTVGSSLSSSGEHRILRADPMSGQDLDRGRISERADALSRVIRSETVSSPSGNVRLSSRPPVGGTESSGPAPASVASPGSGDDVISPEKQEKLNFFRRITSFFNPSGNGGQIRESRAAGETQKAEALNTLRDRGATVQSQDVQEAVPKGIRHFRSIQSAMPVQIQPVSAQMTGLSELMGDFSSDSINAPFRPSARQIEEIFTQSLASTPAIMQWLSYVDMPLSGKSSFSKGMRAWATMLVSLRMKQLGMDIPSDSRAKRQIVENWQRMGDIDDGQQWPRNFLQHAAEHLERLQQNQMQKTDPLWASYVPLPTPEENVRENGMSFSRRKREGKTDSLDLQFYFEIRGLGPVGIKVSYASPDISVRATAETYEGYSRIRETMPLLEERFSDLSLNCHDFSCSRGAVRHPASGASEQAPVREERDADGLNLRI